GLHRTLVLADYVAPHGLILSAGSGGCGAARELSEELESPLDEVLVELEHPAVPGVGVDDELAVRESSIELDGVIGRHHLVAVTVHDQRRLVDAREVGGLLLTPAVDGLQLRAE